MPNLTVKGFDSRDWSGVMPPGTGFRFFGGKLTEADYLPSPGRFERQLNSCKQLGLPVMAWHFHRGYTDPAVQVTTYKREMLKLGLPNKLPAVLDLEDHLSTPSLRFVNNMYDTLRLMEDEFGEVLVYTAKWAFDRWMPFVQSQHDFWSRPLWESDPDPDTVEPGHWTKDDIRVLQKRLDFTPPGFNAKIDEDWADEQWFLAHTGPSVPTPPQSTFEITLRVPAGVKVNIEEE